MFTARSAAAQLETQARVNVELAILTQSDLDISAKQRSNLLTWKGQFSPQLVEAHIRAYGKRGSRVLDPFAGSGTVLVEALKADMEAIGTEINPAAVTLARVYAIAGIEVTERQEAIGAIEGELESLSAASCGIGSLFPGDGTDAVSAVVSLLTKFPRPSVALDLVESLVVSCDLHSKPDWKLIFAR